MPVAAVELAAGSRVDGGTRTAGLVRALIATAAT
jgi:hypothetical protein